MIGQQLDQAHTELTEEGLRLDVQHEIDAVRAQIERALALLKAHSNQDQLSDQIGALEGQLSQLDELRLAASIGNMAQLTALQVGVPVIATTAQAVISNIGSNVAIESALSIMDLSHEQMVARERDHLGQSEHFQQFETDMFTRIDALAAVRGVDVTAFHETQAALKAEYEKAKTRNDLTGMLEADALRATNLRVGLEAVGASETEIQAARQQERATERAYLEQTAIEARREAEARGMSGEAVKAHVEGAVMGADEALGERRAAYTQQKAGLFQPQKTTLSFEVEEVAENGPPLPATGSTLEEASIGL